MSFNRDGLVALSIGQGSKGGNLFSYVTKDAKEEVLTSGYFDTRSLLQSGDFINASCSNGTLRIDIAVEKGIINSNAVDLKGLKSSASEIDKALKTKDSTSLSLFGGSVKKDSDISFQYTEGQYISSNGNINSFEAYSLTSYIPIVSNKQYLINATFSDLAVICLYDSHGKFLTYIDGDTHSENSNVLTTVQDAKYLRCSFITNHGFEIQAYEDIEYLDNFILLDKKVEETKEFADKVYDLFLDIDITEYLTIGTYLTSSGTTATAVGFTYVKLPVLAGDTFYIKGSVVALARLFKADNLIFPSSNQAENTEFQEYIQIEQDGFLEISYLKAYDFTLKQMMPNTSYLRDGITSFIINQNVANNSLHRNMLCLGDSLTSGGNYQGLFNGEAIEECYPYFLNLISGWVTTNAAVNGRTPITYYTNESNTYLGSNYDGCILWLGTNGGLTDTIDLDTASGDYLTYSETETGRYCSIVEKLLDENPNLKIYLVKVFATTGDLEITNSVIEQIAEKYNIYVLDINKNNRVYPAPELHKANNVHFDKIGNKVVASYLYEDILSTINNNIQEYDENLLGSRVSTVFNNL